MLNKKINNLILLIITILILIILFTPFIIEKYKSKYLYKIKSDYCQKKNLISSYMPQQCCYFDKKKKEFICKEKNCRCKSKRTGNCKICY